MNIKLHKMAINYSQTLSEMIQSQIDDIVQKYHCYLSFRDCLCFLIETHQTIYYLLSPYNKQPSPLCSYIRANTNHSHCILSKEKLANKFQNRTKPIYGACYLGLEQFHFPIILCGKIVGMIFIGMYCTNKERSLKRLKQACDNIKSTISPRKICLNNLLNQLTLTFAPWKMMSKNYVILLHCYTPTNCKIVRKVTIFSFQNAPTNNLF